MNCFVHKKALCKADPPRFEHGSPAPEAGVISRLHYGSLKLAWGGLLMNASVIEYGLDRI